MPGGEAAARVEHHAYRMRAGNPAGGQLRIVAFHGAGANDDRIAQRAHPVQVRQVFRAVDVTGRAVRGGDAPSRLWPRCATVSGRLRPAKATGR